MIKSEVANEHEQMVSIVMPVFNAAEFVTDAIQSVQKQSYENWELILIDDRSTDDSVVIIKQHQKSDARIQLIEFDKNLGAAAARNSGMGRSRGRYLAFLDADDFWHPEKITVQMKFMIKNKQFMCFTGYEFTDQRGIPTGHTVDVPIEFGYHDQLFNNLIWTSTVMIDLLQVQKSDLIMPSLNYGEDMSLWLKLMKRYGPATGLNGVYSYYRRSSSTLSANKFKIIFKKFRLYMNIQGISIPLKITSYLSSIFNAIRKRI